tara:strand:- start:302 stop:484 length:183 start_codon:yes stop_codon:yes gene_type:complete
MSYEAGSRECRSLIEAKESLINVIESLRGLEDTDHIQKQLLGLYNELESMHEKRREKENE